jgi:dihydrofolate reductase
MIVTAIAAMDRNGLIGDGPAMPWRLPRDLRRFRARTLGKPVIMGRRTFESLGAPLPGRPCLVLSRDPSFAAEGCRIAHSVEEAMGLARRLLEREGGDEIMIIGGGVVFAQTLPLWDRLLLTVVEGTFAGDAYLPLADVEKARWCLVEREFFGADARDTHPHWFLALDRRRGEAPAADDFDLAGWLRSTAA